MRSLVAIAAVAVVVHQIDNLRRIVMATQAENQAAIDQLAVQLAKVKGEILAKIDALEAAANAGQTLDFGALRGDVQALDDLTPDPAPEPETPVEPETPAE